MDPETLIWVLGVGLAVSVLVHLVNAWNYWGLRGVVILTAEQVGELVVLLAYYDQIEKPEQHFARMLKMTEEEVRIELEKGKVMTLISLQAAAILGELSQRVPIVNDVMDQCKSKLIPGGGDV